MSFGHNAHRPRDLMLCVEELIDVICMMTINILYIVDIDSYPILCDFFDVVDRDIASRGATQRFTEHALSLLVATHARTSKPSGVSEVTC